MSSKDKTVQTVLRLVLNSPNWLLTEFLCLGAFEHDGNVVDREVFVRKLGRLAQLEIGVD